MKTKLILLFLFLALLTACAATTERALDSFYAGHYGTAYKQFSELAAQGDARAQMYLGFLYLEGKGVTQDYAQAMQWFQKAQGQGNSRAEYYIAWMYMEGKGVERDPAVVRQWYLKAAVDGDDYSAAILGAMYIQGDGVDKDLAKGVDWYRKAAELGNFNSQIFMAEVYRAGSYGLPKDEEKERHMFELAAQHKVVDSAAGQEAVRSIIDAHKTYPLEAAKAGVHGTVIISFDCFGQTPERVRVDKSSGSPSLDAAAMSAVEDSVFPRLSPKIMGTTHYILTVTFEAGQQPVLAPAATTSK